jgi:murein L,D-transpeptidase YcbB/YkuD
MTPEERVRKALDKSHKMGMLRTGDPAEPIVTAIREATAELEVENKMLKEALKYCADVPEHRSIWQQMRNVQDVARKALGENNDWVCPLDDPNCKSNCGNYGCGN